MAGQLVDRVREAGLTRVKAVEKKIAAESPRLADLPEEDLEKLARAVVAEGLKDELRKAADLERVDYQGEREKFVARSSRTGSQRTKQLYSDALDRLDDWCRKQGISTLELAPALADDWIESLKAEGKAASTIRLMVAAGSSFWTWLERRHTELRNPFRAPGPEPGLRHQDDGSFEPPFGSILDDANFSLGRNRKLALRLVQRSCSGPEGRSLLALTVPRQSCPSN